MHRDLAGEGDEVVVAGHEVGVAVDLEEHADLAVAVDVGLDRALGGLAAADLQGLVAEADAQQLDRRVEVAARLGQGVLAVHHPRARAVAELLDLLGADRRGAHFSSFSWVSVSVCSSSPDTAPRTAPAAPAAAPATAPSGPGARSATASAADSAAPATPAATSCAVLAAAPAAPCARSARPALPRGARLLYAASGAAASLPAPGPRAAGLAAAAAASQRVSAAAGASAATPRRPGPRGAGASAAGVSAARLRGRGSAAAAPRRPASPRRRGLGGRALAAAGARAAGASAPRQPRPARRRARRPPPPAPRPPAAGLRLGRRRGGAGARLGGRHRRLLARLPARVRARRAGGSAAGCPASRWPARRRPAPRPPPGDAVAHVRVAARLAAPRADVARGRDGRLVGGLRRRARLGGPPPLRGRAAQVLHGAGHHLLGLVAREPLAALREVALRLGRLARLLLGLAPRPLLRLAAGLLLGLAAGALLLLAEGPAPLRDHVADRARDDVAGADRVVVARDDVVDAVRVAVRVHQADDRDAQALGLAHRDGLRLEVDHEQGVRHALHVLHAAEVRPQLLEVGLGGEPLARRQQRQLALGLVALEVVEALDAGEMVWKLVSSPPSQRWLT